MADRRWVARHAASQYSTAGNLKARLDIYRYSDNPLSFHRWVFDHLDLASGQRILELGCGTGRLWTENRDRIPIGLDLTLSDLSRAMIEQAEDAIGDTSGIGLRVIDAQDIPFADGTFDLVVANHMLYHVPDLDRALQEIARVLKPDGRLASSTVGVDSMGELKRFVSGLLDGIAWPPTADPYNAENGHAILKRHFSEVARYDYINGLLVPTAEPLIAYALSVFDGESHRDLRRQAERVRGEFKKAIECDGGFRVHGRAVLFVAYP